MATPAEREEFRKKPSGMTWGEVVDQVSKIVIQATEANITTIRKMAEMETTKDGKAALNAVADIIERHNK